MLSPPPICSQQSCGTGAPPPAIGARRLFPAKVIQAIQVQIQNRVINPTLQGGALKIPTVIKLVDAMPWLQGLAARIIGMGVRPEHVRSPVVSGGG